MILPKCIHAGIFNSSEAVRAKKRNLIVSPCQRSHRRAVSTEVNFSRDLCLAEAVRKGMLGRGRRRDETGYQ